MEPLRGNHKPRIQGSSGSLFRKPATNTEIVEDLSWGRGCQWQKIFESEGTTIKKEFNDCGKRIYEVRQQRGFTREELAEKTDISAKFIYEIERRGKGFSADVLGRLAETLEVSCDFMVYGTKKNP